ncbi:ABC-2 type transport system permease protein [Streptacidiphilus sp. MAP12-16]|uniref:ABC transporter permease n=1 Tax=Streptacidiphilus sp. MAP12-16 TaxID=3156300 RepID=UPI00351618D4
MTTLIKLEIMRVLRNRRYLFFTVIYPVALYALMLTAYGKTSDLSGVSVKAYFMVSMATLGTVGAALTGNAQRISLERKSGWTRQLRLTALPSWGYVVAKIAAVAAATLPAILAVFLFGFLEGVKLSAVEWIALGLTLWVGGFVFAALGVAIGYAAGPDSVQPIVMICYMGMVLLGGTWFPLSGSFGDFAKWTPVAIYNQLGRIAQAGASVDMKQLVAAAAYLAVFVGLAAWLYQRDRKEA